MLKDSIPIQPHIDQADLPESEDEESFHLKQMEVVLNCDPIHLICRVSNLLHAFWRKSHMRHLLFNS